MMAAVQAAFSRVLGHEVLIREDTPVNTFGPWLDIAVLVAAALKESTGIALLDAQLTSAQDAGDLATSLEANKV